MDYRHITSFVLLLTAIYAFFSPEVALAQCGDLRINEIDYDQEGTDTVEFIEIKVLPGFSPAGLELHLINGLTGAFYHTQTLTGTIPEDGYLVVGSLDVVELDLVLGAGGANLIQNGAPDAAGVWDPSSAVYCDLINYEGTVTGYEGWPDIGTDSPSTCTAGASTSLSRRETSPPQDAWVAEACASPGAPNESPTALKLTALTARVAQPRKIPLYAPIGITSTVFALSWLAITRLIKKTSILSIFNKDKKRE